MNILQKVLVVLSLSLCAVPMQAMDLQGLLRNRVLGNPDFVRIIVGYNGLLNSTPYMTADADGQINGHTFISLQGLKSSENQYCAALRKVAHEIIIGEQGIDESEFAQLVEALCDPRPAVQNACCDMVNVLAKRMRDAYVAQYQGMVLAEAWEVRYDTSGGEVAGLLAQLRHHNDRIKKGTHTPNNHVVQTSVVLAIDVMFERAAVMLSSKNIAQKRLAAVLLADLVLNEYGPAQEIAAVKIYDYLDAVSLIMRLVGSSAFELLWTLVDRECIDNASALATASEYRNNDLDSVGSDSLLRTVLALVNKDYEPAYDVSCALLRNISLSSYNKELVFDTLEALMARNVDLDVIQAVVAQLKNSHAQCYMHRSEEIPLAQAYLGDCSICNHITALEEHCEQALHEQVLNEYDVYNECTVS